MIKIHPPHQLLFPNDYLSGVKELEIIYRAAEANGVPGHVPHRHVDLSRARATNTAIRFTSTMSPSISPS